MPRIARKDYNTSFFHIMVQGIRKEYIFNEIEDMAFYCRLIYKYIKKCNVKIIAYCIMNNHAHILTYIEDIKNLSKYMQCINTTYAMYHNKKYKKTGYVFRNRYKVESIFNEQHLNNCIKYIHNNPVKANICEKPIKYKFSSCYEYETGKGKIINRSKEIFPEINIIYNINIQEQEYKHSFIDYEEDKEVLDKYQVIEEYEKKNKISKEEIKLDNKYLKEIVIKLRKECNLTHQEIADEIGINRVKVTRIINEK